MVPLGLGQVILGGGQTWRDNFSKKIFLMTCSNRNCILTTLSKELSDPLSRFVAIAIPDITAACISKGKMLVNLRITGLKNVFVIWYFHFLLI